MCNACHMHICKGLVGPKRGKVKKPLVFKAFLKGQSGHEDARESLQPSEPSNFLLLWSHFRATLGIFGCLWVTWWLLWDHCGVTLGVIGSILKNIHFPNRFQWVYKTLGLLRDCFELILGQLLAYEGDFGSTSGSFRGHFEHIDVEFHV